MHEILLNSEIITVANSTKIKEILTLIVDGERESGSIAQVFKTHNLNATLTDLVSDTYDFRNKVEEVMRSSNTETNTTPKRKYPDTKGTISYRSPSQSGSKGKRGLPW